MKAPGSTMPCCGWRARAIGFGAGELLLAQVDFRLIPELDPVVLERLVELDARARPAAAWPSLRSCMILTIASVSNGFLSTGSILSLCCIADVLDVLEHGRAAVAHQLHGAGESRACRARSPTRWRRRIRARCCGRRDRARACRSRARKRAPSANSMRVDAGAVQHQREEMPDAGFLVDHEAERRACLLGRCAGGRYGPFGLRGSGFIEGIAHFRAQSIQ